MGTHYTDLLYFDKKNIKPLLSDLIQNIPVKRELDFNQDLRKFEGNYPYYSKCGIWLKEEPVVINMLAKSLFFDVADYNHVDKYSPNFVACLKEFDCDRGILYVENLIRQKDVLITKHVKERYRGKHREFFVEGFNFDLCFFEQFFLLSINAGWSRCNCIIIDSLSYERFITRLLEKYSGIYAVLDKDNGDYLNFHWCRGNKKKWRIDLFDILYFDEDEAYYLKIFNTAAMIESID